MPTRRHFMASAAAASLLPRARAFASTSVAILQRTMARGRFVAYQPTALKAFNGQLTRADDASIHADLAVLRPWFDGLITYGAYNGNERVPDIAASLGFHAVVMGVWDPSDAIEMANALAAWRRHPALVAGLSLGNEIVFGRRGSWDELLRALRSARAQAPGLALGVSEPFATYLDDYAHARAVLAETDFLLVNIHPVFEPWFRSATADNWTDFVVRVLARLEAVYPGPILVKETGVPTAPSSAGFSEAAQADFWNRLARRLPPSRRRAFAYFTAFDEPWRSSDFNPVAGAHPEEAHWGLFTEARVAKKVMGEVAKLRR